MILYHSISSSQQQNHKMVSSSFSIACIVLMSFLVLTTTTPSHAFTIDKDVCSNTRVFSHSFCSTFLSSNPIVIKSLLHSLANSTIHLAFSNATKTSQQIIKWQKQTNNTQLKNAYSICSEPYNKAIAALKEAKEQVRSGNYTVSLAAVEAATNFDECEEGFEDILDPSPLASTTHDLGTISSIILAVSEILAKS